MAAPKGHQRYGGRKKGSLNKTTADVKEAIVRAFHKAGGARYLAKLSRTHPHVFCTLVGKIIPAEVKAEITGKDGGPIIQEVIIEHHVAAMQSTAGGSVERQVDIAIPSGPVQSVEVNGTLHPGTSGNAVGENIVVPVVAASGDQEPWIR